MRYKQYHTIVIDPPWPGPGESPAFDRQNRLRLIPYSTMSGVQVATLGIDAVVREDVGKWHFAQLIGRARPRDQLQETFSVRTYEFPYSEDEIGLDPAVRVALRVGAWMRTAAGHVPVGGKRPP